MSLAVLFLVQLRDHSPDRVGLIISFAFLLSFGTIPTCATLVSRWGPKACLFLCCGISSVGYGLYFFSYDLWGVFASALAVAFADRLYASAWPTLLAHRHGKSGISKLFASVTAWKTLFLGLGALSSSLLLGLFGTDGLVFALWVNVLSYLASALALWFDRGESTLAVNQDHNLIGVDDQPLKNRAFTRLVASQTLLSLCWIIPTAVFPLYIPAFTPVDIAIVPVILVVRYASVMVFQVPIANLVCNQSRMSTLVMSVGLGICAIAACASLPIIATAWQTPLIFLITFALAISETVAKPTASGLAVHYAPPSALPRYMATFQLTWTLAYALAPALAGLGAANPGALWLVLSGSLVVSLVVEFAPEGRRTRSV
jgi:MFS family permease